MAGVYSTSLFCQIYVTFCNVPHGPGQIIIINPHGIAMPRAYILPLCWLSWPYRQLLRARKYIISYRIVCQKQDWRRCQTCRWSILRKCWLVMTSNPLTTSGSKMTSRRRPSCPRTCWRSSSPTSAVARRPDTKDSRSVPDVLKRRPYQQQCRSNIVECYNVECCFDIVAVFGNNVEATVDIVASVDRALHS